MSNSISATARWDKLLECLVVAGALGFACFGARPYAGCWNDGSRLATVETLVDRYTWIIDESTFVHSPGPDATRLANATPLPYDPSQPGLRKHGTLDKLYIDGHYYSDKSPVPALLMAGCYRVWQWATGWTAREHPDQFCLAMTLATSGLAYVLAVWCIYRLGRPLRLSLSLRLTLTGSFALATVAAPYVQHVNSHILLLGVTSALVLGLARLMEARRQGRVSWWRFAGLGTLAGLGYTIDLGVGPVLLLCTSVLILSCCFSRGDRGETRKCVAPCLAFGLAALPWLVLHHAINYSIGGTLVPANANAEYFRWPGSPFGKNNLTGSWVHGDPLSFLVYAASMIFGKRGFFGHNLPLFLTVPALFMLLRRCRKCRREVLWAAGCCAGTWLLYAASSNNSSGQCCSIRWFVPLLAPAYYVLALFLKHFPRYRSDFLILSAWGMLLVVLMREGPWIQHMVPFFWPIQSAALCSWTLYAHLRRRTISGDGQRSISIGNVYLNERRSNSTYQGLVGEVAGSSSLKRRAGA